MLFIQKASQGAFYCTFYIIYYVVVSFYIVLISIYSHKQYKALFVSVQIIACVSLISPNNTLNVKMNILYVIELVFSFLHTKIKNDP